jgi:diguanylate cyclase (GGDEF)-like protein
VLWGTALITAWALHAAEPVTLSSLKQVDAISNQEASKHLKARFDATVLYYRSYEGTLFVQDGDKAIYISPSHVYTLTPGDRIRVDGITVNSFRPYVISRNIQVIGHGSLPPPIRASYADMTQGKYDCRYVTIRGQVRSVQPILSTGQLITVMELLMDGGYASVTIDNSDTARVGSLLDAEVEISGAQSGHFDGRMELTGILMHVNSLDQVKVLHKATTDPWSLSAMPMQSVLKAFRQEDHSQRIRVEGTLTYYHPGYMAVLQDGSRAIRISTPQTIPLRLGDRVEAIGMPDAQNDFLTLRLGSIRSLGQAPALKPELLNWSDLALGKYAFSLVSIDGTVVTQVREHAEDVYMISSGGHLFQAILLHPHVYEWSAYLEPPPEVVIPVGSRVRVTGIVQLDYGNPFSGAIAFLVRLRSANDLTVLEAPSWWTVRHLAYIAFVLLGLFLITGVWVWMLNRKVHRQTIALTTKIEAEAALERYNAQLEQRRSKILEQISLSEPLASILESITEFVSMRLNGIDCWCEVNRGAQLGSQPANPEQYNILHCEIPSRSGATLGKLYAALPLDIEVADSHREGLNSGARLATLAIETRALYSDLVHRSEFDLLTDVPNRFALEKFLARHLEQARSSAGIVGLIYLDLDGFKKINDQFGHHTGDLYLMEAARRMRHELRAQDLLARLGGDEFAVIVPAVGDRAQVEEIALRLEHCFSKPLLIEQHVLNGSVSAGVALYPVDGTTTDALLRAADTAMYTAKRNKKA